ncbi:NYN domain-containing protein [Microbispora hainanensis]|uniref:NYN domain-containing protein n=1 Tax=Microbispora hainanensis TaxID=568844 RepID=A0A544YS09_9ACTN|nr:NYN domain-containing protein [Microbispora hainanensis]
MMAVRDNPVPQVLRVGVYVDGFNLYYGLRSLRGRRYLWLDLRALAGRLLRPGQTLTAVRYFSAHVRGEPAALLRQKTYLAVLESMGVEVVLGRFQEQRASCRACGVSWRTYEEKQSDAALAAALVGEVALDLVDMVLLLSADSDLCAAIEAVRQVDARRGGKTRVVTVFPPGRRSDGLRLASDAWFPLGEALVRQSQLPDLVPGRDGARYHRPAHWS